MPNRTATDFCISPAATALPDLIDLFPREALAVWLCCGRLSRGQSARSLSSMSSSIRVVNRRFVPTRRVIASIGFTRMRGTPFVAHRRAWLKSECSSS